MLWFLNIIERIKPHIPIFGKVSKQKYLEIAIPVLCLLSFFPLILAGFYNHMSGDDWYAAKMVHDQVRDGHFSLIGAYKSIWGIVVELYTNWSFTYTGWFIIMPASLSENSVWLHTIFLLSVTALCMYISFSKISRKLLALEKRESGMAAILIVLIMIQYVPSAFSAFYWWSGAMNTVLGFSICILEISFLTAFYNVEERIKPYQWGFAGIGLFLIPGTSWPVVLVLLSCMLLVLIDIWTKKANNYRYRVAYSLLFVLFIASIVFAFTAPGNANRASTMGYEGGAVGQNPIWAIGRAYVEGLYLLWECVNPAIILVIGLICLIVLPGLVKSHSEFKNPIAMLFVSYSIYVAAFVPLLYVEGGPGPERVRNGQYWCAILFLAWNACYLLGWWLKRRKIQEEWRVLQKHKTEVVFLGLVLCFIIMMTGEKEPAGKIAMRDYLKGELQQFDRELDEREAILREAPEASEVYVERLTVIPEYFTGYTDLKLDEEKFWVNDNVRQYYHLRSLHVR